MNTHNSVRSTMAVLAENLFAPAIPAIEASASRATENDEVRNDISGPSGESLDVRAQELDSDEKALGFKHVTTLRVNRLSPGQTDHNPPLKGTYRYTRQLFDKNGPLQSRPTKLLNHPDPLQMWQKL
jgi:hypothetical protein